MRYVFLSLFVLSTLLVQGQSKKFRLAVFGEISIPTYTEIPSVGFGGGLQGELASKRKCAAIATISYHQFNGEIVDHFNSDTIDGFSIMPVLVGLKYYWKDNFFLSGQAGIAIGTQNAGNCFTLSPGAGILLPVKNDKRILIGLNFTAVMRQASYPENNFLNRGGYSFLGGRIGYFF